MGQEIRRGEHADGARLHRAPVQSAGVHVANIGGAAVLGGITLRGLADLEGKGPTGVIIEPEQAHLDQGSHAHPLTNDTAGQGSARARDVPGVAP